MGAAGEMFNLAFTTFEELNRAYTDVIPVMRAVNMAYGHCAGVSGCENLNGRPYVVHVRPAKQPHVQNKTLSKSQHLRDSSPLMIVILCASLRQMSHSFSGLNSFLVAVVLFPGDISPPRCM